MTEGAELSAESLPRTPVNQPNSHAIDTGLGWLTLLKECGYDPL